MRRRPLPRLLRWMMLLCSAALPCVAAAQGIDAPADGAWILSKLARPAPMRTPFVEVRDSPLLKAPLRIAGEYARPDDATLVRRVRTPYVEVTTIRGGQATIERGGKSRTFSLSRVPELAGLQASFGALLAGDQAALSRYYTIAPQGTRGHWTLALTPKDPKLAQRVRDITLYGRGAELRCIETHPAKGEQVQRTLLAGAAQAAEASADGAALAAQCHGQPR